MNRSTVTIKEAVEITGKSESTVKRWMKAGKVQAEKRDGMWHLNRGSLPGHVDSSSEQVMDGSLTGHEQAAVSPISPETFQRMAVTIERLMNESQDNRCALVKYAETASQLRERLEKYIQESANQTAEKEIMRHQLESTLLDLDAARRSRNRWILAVIFVVVVVITAVAGYVSSL